MRTYNWLKMVKKGSGIRNIKLLPVLVAALFLLSAVPAAAEDYVSLYSLGQLTEWCSQNPCGGDGYECEKDAYPCGDSRGNYPELPYKKTTTTYGFRAFADPDDCRRQSDKEENCPMLDVRSLILFTSTYSTLNIQIIDKFPDQFRFFLPPGVISAGVNFFLPGSAKEGIVVRYRNPPEIPGDYSSWLWDRSHYPDLPWNIDFYLHPLDLEQEGVYLPNGNGIIKVLDFHYSEASPMPVADAGWVYVKKLPFDNDQILDVRVTLKINVAKFNAWYESVQTVSDGDYSGCTDSNNVNAPGDYMCWDVAGDPWSEGGAVTPTGCSAAALELCSSAIKCNGVGGYWYDGDGDGKKECLKDPACSGIDVCSEAECCLAASGPGFYWYDGACHSQRKCREDNPQGCDDQPSCTGIGGYWYDGDGDGKKECQAERACTTVDVCSEAECCPAASGPGFYWYNKTCNSEPDVPECSPTSPENCGTSTACQSPGDGHWYDGSCHKVPNPAGNEPECDPEHLSLCTESDCIAAGGYWYDDGYLRLIPKYSCHKDPESGAEDPGGDDPGGNDPGGNVSDLLDKLGKLTSVPCEEHNGYWYNGSCHEEPNPAGNEPECDAEHLSLCTYESDCIAAGGGYWYDNDCHVEPQPICDVEHLSLCTKESDCIAAGGCWYLEECEDKSLLEGHEILEYSDGDENNPLWQAPVSLGVDSWDGNLLAGDKVKFDLNFPCVAPGTVSYAAVYLSDSLFFIDNSTDAVSIFSKQPVSLTGCDSEKPLTQSLLNQSVDICASLGSDYQGYWTVYLLTMAGKGGYEDLDALMNDAVDGAYYYGYYTIEVDCTRASVPAVPPAPQPALPIKEVKPTDTPFTITAGKIHLQPILTVAAEDVGKDATLSVEVSSDSHSIFSSLSSLLTLESEENFSQYFPKYFNLTGQSGEVVDFTYGYILEDGTKKGNAFKIKIQ